MSKVVRVVYAYMPESKFRDARRLNRGKLFANVEFDLVDSEGNKKY